MNWSPRRSRSAWSVSGGAEHHVVDAIGLDSVPQFVQILVDAIVFEQKHRVGSMSQKAL
jgi:hypothetical protein